jgi:predicted phage baseplate assembly protein
MAEPEYLREFEFLPNLPKSDLDDRSFDDLVQECILRIPRYCPDWTNHNPGDPGITLIELFSWLVKQMLVRFNQVPRRNYVAFLELLGIRLQPPRSAQVDLTFYLVKAQQSPVRIPVNTEVATVRTETEPAVVFTTEAELVIGQPIVHRLFTARQTEKEPTLESLNSPFRSGSEVAWDDLGEVTLFEDCSVDNCFYLILSPARVSPDDSIQGNVIALTFRGVVAGTTGINPNHPPLQWSAWDGEKWRSGILRDRQDDKTKGFSFHELRQQGLNPEQEGTDVLLHLPQQWQETDFGHGLDYRGYWIRCTYTNHEEDQGIYSYSPMISSIAVRSIGGTIHASECVRIRNEATEQPENGRAGLQPLGILLGISDGKPGQAFQLQEFPILERKLEEHIQVKLPDGEIQTWQEVPDFGSSGADDRHYTIDALTGVVQFGPLIREPTQLRQLTLERSQIQPWGKHQLRRLSRGMDMLHMPLLSSDPETLRYEEWQYGKVPPIGSEIYMSAYRVGGGSRGNVQAEKLVVLKTAIPYVKRVVNYQPAIGGKEGESLDEAVIRVPEILRTSRAAIIPEDFENIARRFDRSIHRAHCPSEPETPGVVRLLIVPDPSGKASPKDIDFRRDYPKGMHPDREFTLEALGREKRKKLERAIAERKPLGIQVKLDVPDYVGVKVIAEVLLEPQYSGSQLQPEMRAKLLAVLYRFLNPVTGGFDKRGWTLGRALSPSDVVALLQEVPEVRYVGAVKLFSIHKHPLQGWLMSEVPGLLIDPGEWGLFCSWESDDRDGDAAPDSGHVIQFME